MKELDHILFRIVTIRKVKGYSQADVAEKLGIERSTYARKETGHIPLTLNDLLLIMQVLDIRPEALFRSDYQSNRKP
ncbi:MAG: helix-turn-helix transcriptional regulator [Deltaproteobacteria bacterium]|nr:helix-turn-helix transcriptional regulator [Deltaproteobacteria bacterium]MBZ0219192.1 helix-turn-helix domain-containing protein [Deltaproteobacteria bacterium]